MIGGTNLGALPAGVKVVVACVLVALVAFLWVRSRHR